MLPLTAERIELYGGCVECARYWSNASRNNVEGCMHSLAHRNAAAEGLRKVAATKNWPLFLKCVTKARALTGHSSQTEELWATAMTLMYGPTGLHPSRCEANGRPTAETMAMPSVANAMAEAERKLERVLWRFEVECVLGFATWAGLASDSMFPTLYGKE